MSAAPGPDDGHGFTDPFAWLAEARRQARDRVRGLDRAIAYREVRPSRDGAQPFDAERIPLGHVPTVAEPHKLILDELRAKREGIAAAVNAACRLIDDALTENQ